MKFKDWLENKLFASKYKDILKDVPQDTNHHPEGEVLNHVRMVRKSILRASQILNNLKQEHPTNEILSNLNFNLNQEEQKILNISAWLHDIGKATSTTVDGIDFRSASKPYAGKIQAIGHETPRHFLPQIEILKKHAPVDLINFYENNKDAIHFLIERHMDFAHGGFSKKFISSYFIDGKIKNDHLVKMLLILMWADKLGRGKEPNLKENVLKLIEASKKSKKKTFNISNQTKPFEGTPEQFEKMLRDRGLSDLDIKKALQSKYGN